MNFNSFIVLVGRASVPAEFSSSSLQIVAGSHSHYFSNPMQGSFSNVYHKWRERHLAAIISIINQIECTFVNNV